MPKNIVAIQLYNVKGNGKYNTYKMMGDWALESMKKYVKDADEVRFFGKEVKNVDEMFIDVFYELYKMNKEEGANIIFSTCDILAIKPVEMFGKWNYMKLFWGARIKQGLAEDKYYPAHYLKNFTDTCPGKPFQFMNGPIYFPHNLDKKVWDLCFDLLKNWKWKKEWGWDMSIYNMMFYSQEKVQKTKVDDLLDPLIGYQNVKWYNFQDMARNRKITPEKAIMIHFHETRGSSHHMKKFYEKYVRGV